MLHERVAGRTLQIYFKGMAEPGVVKADLSSSGIRCPIDCFMLLLLLITMKNSS